MLMWEVPLDCSDAAVFLGVRWRCARVRPVLERKGVATTPPELAPNGSRSPRTGTPLTICRDLQGAAPGTRPSIRVFPHKNDRWPLENHGVRIACNRCFREAVKARHFETALS